MALPDFIGGCSLCQAVQNVCSNFGARGPGLLGPLDPLLIKYCINNRVWRFVRRDLEIYHVILKIKPGFRYDNSALSVKTFKNILFHIQFSYFVYRFEMYHITFPTKVDLDMVVNYLQTLILLSCQF